MVKFVENELLNIKTEVNDMWQLVYQQLDNAYKSVLNVDMELQHQPGTYWRLCRQHRALRYPHRTEARKQSFIC